MKMSRKKLLQSVKKLENDRLLHFKVLQDSSDIVFGCLYTTMRRCGNPRCKCAIAPCHKQTRIRFSEKGAQKCKSVRIADILKIETAWRKYVKCQTALKKLNNIYLIETKILKDLMLLRRIHYE